MPRRLPARPGAAGDGVAARVLGERAHKRRGARVRHRNDGAPRVPLNDWKEDAELAKREAELERALPWYRKARDWLDAELQAHGAALIILGVAAGIIVLVTICMLVVAWLAS